jgi:hypothetical protein
MSSRSRLLSLVFVLLSSACDGGTPPADAGPPDAGPTECDPAPPAFELGDPTGHAEPLGAAAGEVRAGRLTAAQLPADGTGLGTWEAGDFVIASDRYALIVEDADESDLYDPFGGRPVGIARVEDGRLVEAGDFNELLLGFGSHIVATEQVTVLSDGSSGPAVLRATGPLHPLEFAGDLLTGLVPGDFRGVPAALDYEMMPGSEAIDVYLSVTNEGVRGIRAPLVLTGFFQRFRMPSWTEADGFAAGGDSLSMISFIDDSATSYAWFGPPERPIQRLLDVSGVLVFSSGAPVSVRGCETNRIHLGTMVLGGPGLNGLQEALARHRGETVRTITGTVTEADGSVASNVRVHVQRSDGRHFTRVTPGADGSFEVSAPMEAVSLVVYREGQALAGPVAVGAAQATADIELPGFATLVVEVTDAADARRLPARVQVLPVGGAAPSVPEALGERTHARGRSVVAFTTNGALELRVDPGQHRVIVSRGYEYELHSETVTVAAGDRALIQATLDHAVDTTGVMCADYHIHTHRSPDSADSPRLKLMGLIADGLEIPVRTDHEWVNDFQPVIESMGLTEWAFGVGGEELTTFAWGHFNFFPMVEDRSRPNGSAIPWIGRLPPAVFAEGRARPEAPAFIVNHPRTGALGFGYFIAAGYDPATGAVSRPEMWDDEFTLVEVFNDTNFDSASTEVADWFSFLNAGRRVFAVGSSDSHLIYGAPVGYPRTCLDFGTDDPRELNPNRVRDVTNSGHSTVSGGMYLTVAGPGGAGPGEEATGVGPVASFDVTVQAASWIAGDARLEVYVDGELTETIPITEADHGERAIRLRATGIDVPVAASGSWVVFHAAIEGDLSPVHPGRAPFAVSNPVFLRR